MAINNWRTVIWGYQWNDWRRYVEYSDGTTWLEWTSTPGVITTIPTNSNTFSNSDIYGLKALGYQNEWNDAMARAYWDLASWSDAYSKSFKNITDYYNALANDVSNREAGLAWVKSTLSNELINDINKQRDYAWNTFWPQWTLTKELSSYYWDLDNYLSTDAWRQAATIAAQWQHSGASLGAIRAQQNEAYNESFKRYVQAKEQEINAKQQIAQNLMNYMSTLRQEYGNTTNQYIIWQYERANDLLNNISNSIATAWAQLQNAKLSASLGWSGSSSKWTGLSFNDMLTAIATAEATKTYTKEEADAARKQLVSQYLNINNE